MNYFEKCELLYSNSVLLARHFQHRVEIFFKEILLGVEPPTKFSKRGRGLDRTSTFRGSDFFQGGMEIFTHTEKKSEIFNDKKSL